MATRGADDEQGGGAMAELSRFGGTVLKSSLSKDAEHELQDALHGQPAAV
jgi:uncharacterized membrane protein